jgi:RES domain-containing protein
MILWRISNHADLQGIGGLYASACWHTAGQPIVYLAENPSAALLEVLVHLETDEDHRPDNYQLLKIKTEEGLPYEAVELASLSSEWLTNELETQSRGDSWLAGKRTSLLRVPSAITPETWNWLLNPRHPEAAGIRIDQVESRLYDSRLFRRPSSNG